MSEGNISAMMEVTLEKLKTMTNAETIIGEAIREGNVTIIPVSKVSFGLATGGSDFSTKSAASPLFGGGGGAGVTVSPVAFIVINGDNVRVIPITSETTVADKAISMVPELFDKVKELFGKDEIKEPDAIENTDAE